MSVIVTGMDMPNRCDDCPFHIYHNHIGGERNYVCVATPSFYPMNLANYKGGRKDFCPLKSVEGLIEKIDNRATNFDTGKAEDFEPTTDNF